MKGVVLHRKLLSEYVMFVQTEVNVRGYVFEKLKLENFQTNCQK